MAPSDPTRDALDWLVASPSGMRLLSGAIAALLLWRVIAHVRHELAFHRFLRRHGFRPSMTASTMWLACKVERWSALSSYGQWDGLPVTIERRRRGMVVIVTAERDLVSTPGSGRVSLGAWTRPAPPDALAGAFLQAEGWQLRLTTGDVPDPSPLVSAVVAYARALAAAPVDR